MARSPARGERERRGGGPDPDGKLAGTWRDDSRTIRERFEDGSRTVRGRRGGGNAVRPGRRARRWRGARRGVSASGGEGGRIMAGRCGDGSRASGRRKHALGVPFPRRPIRRSMGVLLPDFSPRVKRAEWAPSVFSYPAGLASGFVAYFFASVRSPAWNQR